VTFQAKLGSLGDKTRRVHELAGAIAIRIGGARELALRAAELCKCDLLTAMVGEFPELQGVMGSYYAQADGEPPEVAAALREHYLPRSAGDALPATRTGLALAIADKLDTIAGIFAIGEKPSGTKDPFGLRRAALGVQRILIERTLDLDLTACLDEAVAQVRADIERLQGAALRPVELRTLPYPGFPTDLQAQMMALLTQASGTSVITETIFENRFMHALELMRMGADIVMKGPTAVVRGATALCGAPVMATDLRASMGLILAGLAAENSTELSRVYHLDRGYEALDAKLRALGATVERVPDEQAA